jgi:hypothetical protein
VLNANRLFLFLSCEEKGLRTFGKVSRGERGSIEKLNFMHCYGASLSVLSVE